MEVGLDPKNDYAFKRVFGHEHTRPLLSSMLDAVLQPPPEHRLVELDLLNPFNDKEKLDDKLSVLDIKARDQSGRQFNIEMQLLAYGAFCPRALYYWAKFHQSQLHKGEDYDLLRPTISICFVNTPLFPAIPDHHLIFELLERQHQVAFSDQLVLHILELSKFTKSAADLTTPLDRWLYFLRHGAQLDPAALPPELDNPDIRRALEVLKNMNQSTVERERYEARQKYLHDMAYRGGEFERKAARAAARARDEGIELGLLIGRI